MGEKASLNDVLSNAVKTIGTNADNISKLIDTVGNLNAKRVEMQDAIVLLERRLLALEEKQ